MRFYRKNKKTVHPIMVVQFFVLYTMFARPNIIQIVHFSRRGVHRTPALMYLYVLLECIDLQKIVYSFVAATVSITR